MADILEYKLVTGSSAEELSKNVSALIAEGWQVSGNPVRCESPQSWAQAMVKPREQLKRRATQPVAVKRIT